MPNHLKCDPVAASLWKLREAALARGDLEAAVAIGWSLIRIGDEIIAKILRT